jgi:hypothetical protein
MRVFAGPAKNVIPRIRETLYAACVRHGPWRDVSKGNAMRNIAPTVVQSLR